jgi:hypothetical protein
MNKTNPPPPKASGTAEVSQSSLPLPRAQFRTVEGGPRDRTESIEEIVMLVNGDYGENWSQRDLRIALNHFADAEYERGQKEENEPLRSRAEIIEEVFQAIVSGHASLDGDDALRQMLNNLADAEFERGQTSR